jgi:ABC-2 type transport system permease protein
VAEAVALVAADVRALRNRLARGSWGDRVAAAAALVVAAGFTTGCYAFFVRVLSGIRRLELLEALLPQGLLALTGQLVAMAALTAFASLFASAILTTLAAAVQARDLPGILVMPVRFAPLYAHRLLRSAFAAGVPIMLVLVPVALAVGHVWGNPLRVGAIAAITGSMLALGATATALALVLALLRAFPAGRVAQLATSASALALAAIIGALRAVRPERLFNPASGAELLAALRSLRLPALESMPSTWMTESWLAVATGRAWGWAVLRLSLASCAAVVLAGAAFRRWHRHAWMRSREARPPALPGLGAAGRAGVWLVDGLPAKAAAVARLELANLTRDAGQWTQLALIVGLVALYLYNLALVPGDERLVGPLLTLLNVGVAGLVLAAVALRLGLPSVSRDGPSRWLAEAAPISARTRLAAKAGVVAAALVLLGGGLTGAAAALLAAPPWFKLEGVAAVVLMGATLAAVAVGVGARFPRYDLADPVQVAVSSGGLLCFAAMLAYVALMTALAARPVLSYYLRIVGAAGVLQAAAPWAAVALQLVLSLVVGLGALRWGGRALER